MAREKSECGDKVGKGKKKEKKRELSNGVRKKKMQKMKNKKGMVNKMS